MFFPYPITHPMEQEDVVARKGASLETHKKAHVEGKIRIHLHFVKINWEVVVWCHWEGQT